MLQIVHKTFTSKTKSMEELKNKRITALLEFSEKKGLLI